jgi:hypothetical protein
VNCCDDRASSIACTRTLQHSVSIIDPSVVGSSLRSTMAFGILPPLAAYQGQQFCLLAFTEDILDPAIGNEPHHRD